MNRGAVRASTGDCSRMCSTTRSRSPPRRSTPAPTCPLPVDVAVLAAHPHRGEPVTELPGLIELRGDDHAASPDQPPGLEYRRRASGYVAPSRGQFASWHLEGSTDLAILKGAPIPSGIPRQAHCSGPSPTTWRTGLPPRVITSTASAKRAPT